MSDKQLLIAGAGVLAALYFLGHKLVAGLDSAADAITPTNPDNIFYRGVNAVGDILDDGNDDDSFSLGSWLYDLSHSDEV